MYGEACDHCGDPEPGMLWVSDDVNLCDPCYQESLCLTGRPT